MHIRLIIYFDLDFFFITKTEELIYIYNIHPKILALCLITYFLI